MSHNCRGKFREEASRLLGELESLLLELGSAHQDQELAGRVCRALHCLNRAGVLFGFRKIAAVAGDIEPVFNLVCIGRITVTPELIGLALVAGDRMRKLLYDGGDGDGVSEAVMERMRRLGGQDDATTCGHPIRAGTAPLAPFTV
jgi:chemotaxis protein histidine kinase CheA